MKRLFLLPVVVLAALALFSGCQKYDDSEIRQEIKELGDRITALEAWCKSSQEAIDNVAKLKEAVDGMNSVESVEAFDEDGSTGYAIKFTNGQSIKLYNGKDGKAFFGNVNVGSSSVEFILADGTRFIVDRITASITFDSFETKIVARGDTIWTVMDKAFTKSEYAAFTAELKTDDGTATSITTKSATENGQWKIEAIAPEFNGDGKLVRPAGVVFKETPQAGNRGLLKVSLITNDGKEVNASLVVENTSASTNYLSFRAIEAGATVSMKIVGQCGNPSLEYSTDLKEWTTFDFGNPQTITLENAGDRVYWRNAGVTDQFSKDEENYIHFELGDKKIAADGNIMSLIDQSCQSLTIPSDYCFMALFDMDSTLVTAPELPATELAPNCYCSLFFGCSSLETAPELPARNMAYGCYYAMFYGCSSLETAPELPATIMEPVCYKIMFARCTSLKEAPDLPAESLADDCYYEMFGYCTSLIKAPELPASKVVSECYVYMFEFCTSLVKAPELPATELDRFCYYGMFRGCSNLKEAPELPAKELELACYGDMFDGCTSLEKAPKLPAMVLAERCYYGMLSDCTSLTEAPELPATELKDMCYSFMFYNTAIEKAPVLPATDLAAECYLAMFQGCAKLREAPELPATKMYSKCYQQMFASCESLKATPELPAMILAEFCYSYMFNLCTSLKDAPELPATSLSFGCYYSMFMNCTSLTEAPALPATKIAGECYCDMFAFSGLEKAPELPATELVTYCYDYMFEGCESLEEAPYLPAKKLYPGCYEGLFMNCINLKHIKVGFENWGNGSATADWALGVPPEGLFECPEELAVKYGRGYIPTGWSVNGVAPAATKSIAAPATRTAGGSRFKPVASKMQEIQDKVADYGMITL